MVSERDRDTAPFLYMEPPSGFSHDSMGTNPRNAKIGQKFFCHMEPPSELELQTKLMDRITPATEFSSHSDKYSSSICDTIYSRDFANDHHMHSQYTSLFRNTNDLMIFTS